MRLEFLRRLTSLLTFSSLLRLRRSAKQQELSLLKRGVLPRRETGQSTPTQQSAVMARADSQDGLNHQDSSTLERSVVALQKGPSAPPINSAALRAARRKTIDPSDSIPLRRAGTSVTTRPVIPGQGGASRRPSLAGRTSASNSSTGRTSRLAVTSSRPSSNDASQDIDSSAMPPPATRRPRSDAISSVAPRTSVTSSASSVSRSSIKPSEHSATRHSRASSIASTSRLSDLSEVDAETAIGKLTISQSRGAREKERERIRRVEEEKEMDLSELTMSASGSLSRKLATRKSTAAALDKENHFQKDESVSAKARRISLAPCVPVNRIGARAEKDVKEKEVGVSRKRSAVPA